MIHCLSREERFLRALFLIVGIFVPVAFVATQAQAQSNLDAADALPRPITKPTGSGTGLGLSLAHDIIARGHGGTLTVESEEGEGTTFIISMPDVVT